MSTARVKTEDEETVHVLIQTHNEYGIRAVEVYDEFVDAKEAMEEAQGELDEHGIENESLRLETNKLVR